MALLLDYCSPAEILPREHAWETLSKKAVEVARRAVPATSSNGGAQLSFFLPGQVFGSTQPTVTVSFTKQ